MSSTQSNAISIEFQLITLSITTAIILFLIAGQVFHFCSIDKKPTLYSFSSNKTDSFITPQKQKMGLKPNGSQQPGSLAQPVDKRAKIVVGLTITEFSEFNVTENKFKITGIISFAFDPKQISLETIKKFSFLRGDIKEKSEPHVKTVNGSTIAYFSIKVAFRTNLYHGFFPFEDHRIFLGLINDAVSAEEAFFEVSLNDFIIDPQVDVSGWSYLRHKVKVGYGQTELSTAHTKNNITYPEVVFIMDFFHYSLRYIIIIMLPLLIIFFIDLFSFCLDQKQNRSTLVQISTGNIVALVAYRFVIESISPKVGYPMIVDYIFFLFLSISFTMFIINSIGPYLTVFHKKCISLGVQLVVIAIFIYLLEFWIPC